MTIKVYVETRVKNAHYQKNMPHPESVIYLGTSNSTDVFDEQEYNVYVRRKDGVLLAVPRPVH